MNVYFDKCRKYILCHDSKVPFLEFLICETWKSIVNNVAGVLVRFEFDVVSTCFCSCWCLVAGIPFALVAVELDCICISPKPSKRLDENVGEELMAAG